MAAINATAGLPELQSYAKWLGRLFTAIAALMTFSFGYSLGGDSALACWLIGIGLAAVTVLVSILLNFVDLAWKDSRPVALGILAFWGVCVAVEYFSHVGFTVGHRTGDVQKASLQDAAYAGNANIVRDLEAKVKRLEAKHDWQKSMETPEAYEAKITGMQGDLIWKRSKGCTNATLDDSRAFCARLASLKAEQAIASDRAIVAIELKDAQKELIAARKTSNTTAKGDSHVYSQTAMVAQIATGNLAPTATAMQWAGIGIGAFISLVFSFAGTVCNFLAFKDWGGSPGNRTQPHAPEASAPQAAASPAPAPTVVYWDRIVDRPIDRIVSQPAEVVERVKRMLIAPSGGLVPLKG